MDKGGAKAERGYPGPTRGWDQCNFASFDALSKRKNTHHISKSDAVRITKVDTQMFHDES